MKLINTSFQEFAAYVKDTDKNIIFWGAGAIGRVLIPYICSQYSLESKVLGYIDNNPAKQGRDIGLVSRRVPVYSAEFLKKHSVNHYVLMITNGDFYPVLEQLKSMPEAQGVTVCIAPIIQLQEKTQPHIQGIYKCSEEPLIPKTIHYIWFSGTPIPDKLQKCIDSWKEKCPDYEVVRWDASNYDYKKYPYTRQAYEAERWGYVADVARLEILYEYGGFYLDTDVELLKSLDELRFQKGFCGREDWGHVNFGGGSGCVKHLDIVGELLDFRKDVPFLLENGQYNVEASGYYETKPLMDRGLSITNQTEIVEDLTVYASEFFCPYNYISGRENITDQTISIHYFSGSWLGEAGTRYRRETREKFRAVSDRLEPLRTIEVTVLCLAYNHVKYIRKALDSIISQKTNFAFEIVIHDDKSTDGTMQVIEEYEKKFPDLIKPLYESENQVSQGIDPFLRYCLPAAQGKYIAVCECDDYWMDDSKLQRQYNAMEAHPELDMCACRAVEVSGQTELVLRDIRPKTEDTILTAEEVILGGGGYLATASLFFRKSMFRSLMRFEKILCFDYSWQIKGALRGGIYYLDRTMAAYRKGIEGSWTVRVERDQEKRALFTKQIVEMLHELDRETEVFHTAIEQRISAYQPFYDQLMSHVETIRAEIAQIPEKECKWYLWGLGLRGDAFQKFCRNEKISLNGVCDLQNACIGEITKYGYQVFDADYVLHNSDVIFASNDAVYSSLAEGGYSGRIISLQKYMPFS